MKCDDPAGLRRQPTERLLRELLAVDYYEGIKALYCSDRFTKDDAGWQALIDCAWADALAKDAARRCAAGQSIAPLPVPGLGLH